MAFPDSTSQKSPTLSNFSTSLASEPSTSHSTINSTDDTSWLSQLILSTEGMIVISALYAIISLLTIIGNLLIIVIIIKSPRMKTVTNYFIANMAFGDILIGVFGVPFQYQAALLQKWVLPKILCPVVPFITSLIVNVSIFSLTIIALDRYYAICRPLTTQLNSKRLARRIILLIWFIATVIAFPSSLMWTKMEEFAINEIGEPQLICYPYLLLDRNNTLATNLHVVYTMSLPPLQYLIPLTLITALYIRIGRKIWGQKTPGASLQERDRILLKNKRKVIKSLVLVVLLFALSWLPLQLYTFLSEPLMLYEYRDAQFWWLVFNWVAMSNTCHNPVVYAIVHKKFKTEFYQLLNKVCRRNVAQQQKNLRVRQGSITNENTWSNTCANASCPQDAEMVSMAMMASEQLLKS